MYTIVEKHHTRANHPYLTGTVYYLKNELTGEVGMGGYTTKALAEERATEKMVVESVIGQPILVARQILEDKGLKFGVSVNEGKRMPTPGDANSKRYNFVCLDGIIISLDYVG